MPHGVAYSSFQNNPRRVPTIVQKKARETISLGTQAFPVYAVRHYMRTRKMLLCVGKLRFAARSHTPAQSATSAR